MSFRRCQSCGMPASSRRNSASRPAQSRAASRRPQLAAVLRRPPVRRQRVQQALVQAQPHLPVRIPQPVHRPPVASFGIHDRQVAGLGKQQRFRRHHVHVEGRQQGGAGVDSLEVGGREAATDKCVHQEPRRRGLEPVRLELAAAEQLEQGEGVVDRVRSQPTVAVVPGADCFAVQTRQLRREHGIQVRLGVAADRRVIRIHGEVDEVVEVREQADPGEPAHPL